MQENRNLYASTGNVCILNMHLLKSIIRVLLIAYSIRRTYVRSNVRARIPCNQSYRDETRRTRSFFSEVAVEYFFLAMIWNE